MAARVEKLRLRVANAAWALGAGQPCCYRRTSSWRRGAALREQGPGCRPERRRRLDRRETALAGAALTVTGYSRMLGKKLEQAEGEPVDGAIAPSPLTSTEVAKAQKQLKVCQWLVPGLTAGLQVLNAVHASSSVPATARTGCEADAAAGDRRIAAFWRVSLTLAKSRLMSSPPAHGPIAFLPGRIRVATAIGRRPGAYPPSPRVGG